MSKKPRRRRGSFLDSYRLDDAYLLRPDLKGGRPGILSGTDEDGQPVLVKVWTKSAGTPDSELREIWHHEIRQLHRLGGYFGAGDTIATLQQAGNDEAGFYLVLDPGQRRPLESLLAQKHPGHWLTNQRSLSNRAKLWRNLTRISSGLEILHTQGLIHKNLDKWAILTTGSDEPDFLLTGFEWSIRLVGAAARSSSARRPNRPSSEPASFLQDWRDFGFLAADLMNVPLAQLADHGVPLSSVSGHMSVDEVRLLRNLIQAERMDRLDGEVVERWITDVVRTLEAEIAALDTKFHLVVWLAANSRLSQEVREASDGEVEMDAVDDQMDFIKDDLGESPLLIAIRVGAEGNFRLVLQGTKLLYRLNPYLHRREGATPTWEFAYCDNVEDESPAGVNVIGNVELGKNSLSFMGVGEARSRFGRLRGKLRSWETLREEFVAKKTSSDRTKRFHQALALTQFLEALYAAADAFPVMVLGVADEIREDMNVLSVEVRADIERDALSKAIGLKSPASRFDEELSNDRRGGDWVLTEAQHVGAREFTDTLWRFEGKKEQSAGPPSYIFVGQNPPPRLKSPVLIPGDFVARDIQFQRRLKALRALADHAELLWMLVDPRRRILDRHEAIAIDDTFADLDDSKQKAMTAIVETLPLFLIQGPPGVGKTRMIRELVKRTFKNDATARLLLTAQSNAAVDHLMDTVHQTIDADKEDILIVRCRSRDSYEDQGHYEIENQTRDIIKRFSESSLVLDAPENLQLTIAALARDLGGGKVEEQGLSDVTATFRSAKQAMEGLVVRAANVVFATTNSSQLERLIEERGQFDWSIIEEAGKATGGELVAPLLLSYRRLLIGDHKQLSPFGSERLIGLLEDPDAVVAALKTGQEFISRTLRNPSTDEVLDEIEEEDQEKFAALCTLAIDCLLLFERLIEDEFALQEKKPKARPLGHRLDQQHRMHPAIARLVSRCFYGGELHTHATATQRFRTEICPVISSDTKRLPNAPIVVIDMPYIQNCSNSDSI